MKDVKEEATPPTIPSRFKPPKRRFKPEPKGFGSTDRRFVHKVKGVPGPASYPKIYENLICKKSPSISTKGHFASKVPRLPDPNRPKTPGPGSYSLPGVGSDVQTSSSSGTAAFLPNGMKGRVPFPKTDYRPGIPGPLSYKNDQNSRMSNWEPKLLRHQNMASFRSNSSRDSAFDSMSCAPGPGIYHIESGYDITTVTRSAQWSKTGGPQRPPLFDSKVPGPGYYYQDPLASRPLKVLPKRPASVNSKRISSPPTIEDYVFKDFTKCKHTFGPGAGQRFKDSFYGRLDLIGQIPGPGAYSPSLNYQEQNRVSSPFRSRSPSRESPLKHPSLRAPGPLYYKPKFPSDLNSSFRFNKDGSWV